MSHRFVVRCAAACALALGGTLAAAPVAPVAAQQGWVHVQRVELLAADSATTLIVHTPVGAEWSLSEPFYLEDRVRLHLDVAAPRVPRLVLPGPAGLLLELSAADDLTRTRLHIDLAGLGALDAFADGDRITIRVRQPVAVPATGVAIAALETTGSPARTPVPDAWGPRFAAGVAAIRGVTARAAEVAGTSATAARAALLATVGRTSLAVGLGVGLAVVGAMAVVLLARRRRPRPRSVVLGLPGRPASAHPAVPAAMPAPMPAAVMTPVLTYAPPPRRSTAAPVAQYAKSTSAAAAPAPATPPSAAAAPAPARRAATAAEPVPARSGARSQASRPPAAVRNLAAGGMSHGEIAARLRMSRDAVGLLLATGRLRPDEAAASGRNFPAGRARQVLRIFGRRS